MLNLASSSSIKIDSISQALPNLMGSMHDVSNTWVIWPIFANKYQLVHMVNMKMTMMKCGEKPNHGRNPFSVHLAYQNAKNYLANIPIVRIFMCHQFKAHLQYASI
jgi:hypothetical protein